LSLGSKYFGEAHIILLQIKRALRVRTRLINARRWGVRYGWGWFTLQNWWYDRPFGQSCGGVIPSPFSAQGANATGSCNYRTLAHLFGDPLLRISPSDVLVDIGCGKGRVINYWLRSGLRNRIVGVELNPVVGEWTRARLARFKNVEIIVGDAIAKFPSEGTVFFLFHSFGQEPMEEFARQLLMRVDTRTLRIVYLNARHVDVFDRAIWDVRALDSGSPDRAVLIRHVQGVAGESLSAITPSP
jgi:SAM-dependent methyltransferase